MHSTRDVVTEAAASAAFEEASAAEDKTFIEYDAGAHHLLCDTDDVQARVLADLTAWVLKRAPA